MGFAVAEADLAVRHLALPIVRCTLAHRVRGVGVVTLRAYLHTFHGVTFLTVLKGGGALNDWGDGRGGLRSSRRSAGNDDDDSGQEHQRHAAALLRRGNREAGHGQFLM